MGTQIGISRSLLGLGVLLSVGVCLIALVSVSFFPWLMRTSDLTQHEERLFQAPWPRSLLAEEQESRKRLRRFPKSEQQRRLSVQLRRMEFLNTTLVDMMDVHSGRFEARDVFDAPLRVGSWPVVYRGASSGGSGFVFGYFPLAEGFALQRGVLLRSGDEFRFSAPLTREARSVTFSAFPLTASSLRGALGKYSFSAQFEAKDVRQLKRVSHVVNDDTAKQFSLKCLHGELLLLAGRVTRFDKVGRLPVQLASDDPFWTFSGAEDLAATEGESDLTGSVLGRDELPQGEQNGVPGGGSDPVDMLREPLDELSNPVVGDAPSTVAVGYNLLLVSSPGLGEHEASRDRIWPAHEAELGRLVGQSVRFEMKSPGTHAVQGKDGGGAGDGALYPFYREIAQTLKAYGYHINAVLEADALQKGLLRGLRLEGLAQQSWLSSSDAALENTNREIEKSMRPVKGLDAIFEREEVQIVRGLGSTDWSRLREHSLVPGRIMRTAGDLPFDDLRVLDGRSAKYLARAVDAFQDWGAQNIQFRFAYYLDLLGRGSESMVPTLQGLLHGLRQSPATVINPFLWTEVAVRQEARRAVNQVLEALRARRVAHRTVVVIAEQPRDEGGGWGVRVFIPGLRATGVGMAAGDVSPVHSFEQLGPQLLQWVGAPQIEDQNAGDAQESGNGKLRYRLTIKGGAGDCAIIRWVGREPVEDLNWSGLRVEGWSETGMFDFYPCSVQGSAWIEWSQRASSVPDVDRQPKGGGARGFKGVPLASVVADLPWGGRFIMQRKEWQEKPFLFLTSAEMRTGPELSILHFLRIAAGEARSGDGVGAAAVPSRSELQSLVVGRQFLSDPDRRLEIYTGVRNLAGVGLALLEVVRDDDSGDGLGFK